MKKNGDSPKEAFQGFRTPKGMHDVTPQEGLWWERVESVVKKIAEFYHYGRIRTPVLEYAELFRRTAGETADIVEKEMYTLTTKGGDVLALRPEGTAPVMRAYLEHGLSRMGGMQKFYYIEPMFRHDKPQAGRYRQFTQLGFEVIGSPSDPLYDAQVILIFMRIFAELKIKNVSLKVNSIGCRICRPIYKKHLQAYYKPHLKNLCEDCDRRYKTNPLRLLDCKNPGCQEYKAQAPNFLDRLCSPCMKHFKEVLEYLDELALPYSLDHQLVRGLDYYSRTVFEVFAETPKGDLGAIAGGGRYDYLMEVLGKRPMPAIGGAMSFERVIDVMKAQEIILPQKASKKVFLIHVGEQAKKKMLSIAEELREGGIALEDALSRESLKGQMKAADKGGSSLALILGQKEMFEQSIIIRDLRNSLQETVSLDRIVEEIKKRLKA